MCVGSRREVVDVVKKYITWVAPDSNQAYTHTEVWKSTNQGVSWTEFTASNDPNYGADGIVIVNSYCVDNAGDSGHWYKIRFYDNVSAVYSDWSDYMTGSDFRGYCSITDVRNYTNVQSAEYSDAAVQMMIDTVTKSIDRFTGRTWQGIQTVTDKYLDGDGTNYLFVSNDLKTVTGVAIDQGSGTFTTISLAYVFTYLDKGTIYLDPNNAELLTFPNKRRSVKVSYTYGNADPTDDVRHLAVLMVANMMKMDATRTSVIAELKAALRTDSYYNTTT